MVSNYIIRKQRRLFKATHGYSVKDIDKAEKAWEAHIHSILYRASRPKKSRDDIEYSDDSQSESQDNSNEM